MTKILIDRSTAELALEALDGGGDSWQRVGPAIDALKAALAEPQRRKTGKPRNATTRLGVVCFEAYARSYVGSNRWDIAAEAVRRAALAEPQEPVAKCIDDICSEHLGRVEAFDHLPRGTLLYAAPPQRPAKPQEPDSPERRCGGPGCDGTCCQPVQEPQGCAHCNHPLYAAVKCRVCGRVTEPVQEPVLGIGGKE